MDDETGLYSMGARYYAAWLGRWTSADPMGIGADGPGVYNYTRGSPIGLVDPSGTDSQTVSQAPNPLDQIFGDTPADVMTGYSGEAPEPEAAPVDPSRPKTRASQAYEPGSAGVPTDVVSENEVRDIEAKQAKDRLYGQPSLDKTDDAGRRLWDQGEDGTWTRREYISLPVGTSDVEVALAAEGAGLALGAGLRTVGTAVSRLRSASAYSSAGEAGGGVIGSIEELVGRLRQGAHTPTSAKGLERLSTGETVAKLEPRLSAKGTTPTSAAVNINPRQSVEEGVTTLVHELQHALDLAGNVVKPKTEALPWEQLFAEMRGFAAARDYAQLNKLTTTRAYRLANNPDVLALDVRRRYKDLVNLSGAEVRMAINKFLKVPL